MTGIVNSNVAATHLLRPGPLDEVGVDDLVPPVLALHVRAVLHAHRDHVPLLAVLLHERLQPAVLHLGPTRHDHVAAAAAVRHAGALFALIALVVAARDKGQWGWLLFWALINSKINHM